ncbi:hypothetical protein GGR51DRAFT_578142 [Nemania sp. FL0031]|nr:hypothetical protein GGR51DRAFT_578142 [Nemania sp. FL0031]
MAAPPADRQGIDKPLPPYNEAFGASRAFQRRPGPATYGRWYKENPEPETLKFTFCPNPSQPWFTQDWFATLLVKCGDIPRLMREGFYWDVRNVRHEDGFVREFQPVQSIPTRLDGRGWCGVRYYYLEDSQRPFLRWTASIQVLAIHEITLYNFSLSLLSRERIQLGQACGRTQSIESAGAYLVYQYLCYEPRACFNAIYGNMPLEGYWPWPRRDTETNGSV